MFTVIKKETAWREVGLGVGEGRGEDWGGGLAQTPHLPPWGLGFPSHADPRAVLDLWRQAPVGFFLGKPPVHVSGS